MLTNSNFYIGDSSISRLYQGDNLVWDSSHPDILLSYIDNGTARTQPLVYFDTGVVPTIATKTEIKFSVHTNVANTVLFGTSDSNTSVASRYYYALYAGLDGITPSVISNKMFLQGISIGPDEGAPSLDIPHTSIVWGTLRDATSISGINMICDSSIYSKSGVMSAITTANSIYLLARNVDGTADRYCPATTRVYYIKIWDNNNLIRFYIPVLHYTNGQYTPCFYDKVNDTYIYNLGTDTPTYKISGDYLLDYIQNGPDSFSAVGVSYDTGLDSSVNLYYDVILRTPDASIWSGYRTLMGTGTVSGTDTGKAYSHQALYAYNSNYAIYNGVDTIGGNNINVNGNATFPIGDKVRISLNSLNNKLYAWFSNDSSTENLGGGYQDVPAAVPNGDFLLFGERQIDNTTTSYSYGGLRFYMLNFRYANNTPAKTFIPVLHNNQAVFLDLNSGTYIYSMGTQIPYYQFKS